MSMNFFVFAGEHSGDLHGSHLLKALKEQIPDAAFSGVAGPKMRSQRITPILNMEEFEVMGFTDVVCSLPKLWKLFHHVRDWILENSPAFVILIDYPDFNLRLAKALRKKGYRGKIVQYISPSVWAWRKGRINSMEKNYDLLMTIYPFEEKYYQDTKLDVKFIGNPIKEYIIDHVYHENWRSDLNIPCDIPMISLFPGSRHGEIARNLPLQLQAAEMLLKKVPNRIFAISCNSPESKKTILEMLQQSTLQLNHNVFLVPRLYTYELMNDSQTAIAKSGTVTLELALHQRPTVVVYSLTAFNHFIAKYLFRINLPHYCIVNILSENKVFPEMISRNLSAQHLFETLHELDSESNTRKNCLSGCHNISTMLKIPNASREAARAILGVLT